MKEQRYDVIVVGAGPAGSVAAKTAAERGLSVLLIEKRQEIGEPVRCAEAITAEGLAGFAEPDPKWVCARVRRAKIFSPSGQHVEFRDDTRDVAYILERKVFDRELARRAAYAGAEVLTKTQATGLLLKDGIVRGITGKSLGEDFRAEAGVVIAADGVESRVARWAGINTVLRSDDIAMCAQYHLIHPDIEPESTEFYFGSKFAPGGYAWVFPKGDGEANVGLGTTKRTDRTPLRYLEEFARWRFPGASILQTVAGGVPLSKRTTVLSKGGLMLAGDAGRLSDPATGEGILNGMISGEMAGKVAAEAIEAGDASASALRVYDEKIAQRLGPMLDRNYLLKQFLTRASDLKLNLTIRTAKVMNVERFSASDLLNELYGTEPGKSGVLNMLFQNGHGHEKQDDHDKPACT